MGKFCRQIREIEYVHMKRKTQISSKEYRVNLQIVCRIERDRYSMKTGGTRIEDSNCIITHVDVHKCCKWSHRLKRHNSILNRKCFSFKKFRKPLMARQSTSKKSIRKYTCVPVKPPKGFCLLSKYRKSLMASLVRLSWTQASKAYATVSISEGAAPHDGFTTASCHDTEPWNSTTLEAVNSETFTFTVIK